MFFWLMADPRGYSDENRRVFYLLAGMIIARPLCLGEARLLLVARFEMAYTEYDARELRKLQVVSTGILKELDRVCGLLDIPYFIYSGTAIGAIRHGGFIPWDDDIDIGMLRTDYERFLLEAPSVLADDFIITNGRTDKHYPACNSNLSLKGTYCVPSEFDKCEFQYPIGIGLFAFDRVSEDPVLRKKQFRQTWFWGRISFLRETGKPNLFVKGWKRGLALVACRLGHSALVLFRVSQPMIHRRWEKAARLAECEEGTLFADFTDGSPLTWSAKLDEIFPLSRIAFEDIEVNMANNYDEMLRRSYGDYMALPPEEDRKNHYPSRLDFGKYA